MSSESREYLLRKSITYTFEHPIFGVGPRQFASYEGQHNRIVGTHGLWNEAHNSFTQASSECGIPALIFFLAGIVSTYRLLNGVWREARRRPDCGEIRVTAFCAMLGLTAFLAAIAFLNFAYFFYLPAMGGFAIALRRAAQREFRLRRGPGRDSLISAPPRQSSRPSPRYPQWHSGRALAPAGGPPAIPPGLAP